MTERGHRIPDRFVPHDSTGGREHVTGTEVPRQAEDDQASVEMNMPEDTGMDATHVMSAEYRQQLIDEARARVAREGNQGYAIEGTQDTPPQVMPTVGTPEPTNDRARVIDIPQPPKGNVPIVSEQQAPLHAYGFSASKSDRGFRATPDQLAKLQNTPPTEAHTPGAAKRKNRRWNSPIGVLRELFGRRGK